MRDSAVPALSTLGEAQYNVRVLNQTILRGANGNTESHHPD